MKKVLLITTSLLIWSISVMGQEEKLEVEGAIQIAGSEDPTPDPGTIRWTGSDFEGWNGTEWVSLTAGKQYVEDIDNNSYRIVTIGTQTWMAENLRVTRCNDSTAIPLVTVNATWEALSTAGYTWYNNGGSDYGALYNGYAVINTCNICPTGWHVPNDAEWIILSDYLGGQFVAGGKMKEAGLAHWLNPNTGATNESGWTGLPGGFRNTNGDFGLRLSRGFWWSSTGFGGSALYRGMQHYDGNLEPYGNDKRLGFSVRCLRD